MCSCRIIFMLHLAGYISYKMSLCLMNCTRLSSIKRVISCSIIMLIFVPSCSDSFFHYSLFFRSIEIVFSIPHRLSRIERNRLIVIPGHITVSRESDSIHRNYILIEGGDRLMTVLALCNSIALTNRLIINLFDSIWL